MKLADITLDELRKATPGSSWSLDAMIFAAFNEPVELIFKKKHPTDDIFTFGLYTFGIEIGTAYARNDTRFNGGEGVITWNLLCDPPRKRPISLPTPSGSKSLTVTPKSAAKAHST